MSSKVVIYEDIICENHLPETSGRAVPLPEIPGRVKAISEALREASFSGDLKFVSPEPATTDELLSIHKPEHIAHVANQVRYALEHDCMAFVNHDSDVVVTSGSDLAARYAAGAVRDAVIAVLGPGYDKRAFCNVRPPGHHAHCHKGEGFCLYNNVWFGAQAARKFMIDCLDKKEPRIAIVDWDVHHGDGTQDFVMKNQNLFTYFVSIHQKYTTQFPKTGKECKKVRGNSIIECHNIKPGGGDAEVKEYFNNTLIQSLLEWKPDLILISCGFDAHHLDPIGQLTYSSKLYGWMTQQLIRVADTCCGGHIVSVLEGGYSLKALRESVVEHVQAMLV